MPVVTMSFKGYVSVLILEYTIGFICGFGLLRLVENVK